MSLWLLPCMGISFAILQNREAAHFALGLESTPDSEPRHSLTTKLLEKGKSESKDTVPLPEASGFDFYI